MKTKKRSANETANIVEETVGNIKKVLEAGLLLRGYGFFDHGQFRNGGADNFIKNLCFKNDIAEAYIRKVADIQAKLNLK